MKFFRFLSGKNDDDDDDDASSFGVKQDSVASLEDDDTASIISDTSLEIIKATAPVVKEHILEITTLFYDKLLSENPSLYNLFNESNQNSSRQANAFAKVMGDQMQRHSSASSCPFATVKGTSACPFVPGTARPSVANSQAKTLGDAVVAYALNIDQLDTLTETVARIANKHCALGVQPEHYQVVHDYLMDSVGTVLGEAVTPEVAAAWSEAVMALAKIFIQVETDLYTQAEKAQWKGIRKFTISNIVDESRVIKSFYMVPQDSDGISDFTPGQYLSVYEKPPGKQHFAPRHYTITSQPTDNYYRISVKKADDLGIMSSFLHTKQVGDTIDLGAAFGPTLLSENHLVPAVFVSVGVGITPSVAVLPSVLQERTHVAVFHADTEPETFAFQKALKSQLAAFGTSASTQHYLDVSYSNGKSSDSDEYVSAGRLTGQKIVQTLSQPCWNEAEFYLCAGNATPSIVKQLVTEGVSKERIHVEFFGPFMNAFDNC